MLINIGRFSPIWRGFALLVVAIVGIASTIASSSGGSGGTPPTVTITSPPPDFETTDPGLTVTGTASDETGIARVTVNGIGATSNNGFATWSAVVTLDEGLNSLTVAAVDSLGFADPSAAEQNATLTSVPPLVTVSFPPAHSFSDADSLTVTGTATDARSDVASVEVNGVAATSTDGFATWQAVVPLTVGLNTLTVSAADSSGSEDPNAAEVEVTVAADVSGNAVTFGDGYAIALNGNLAYVVDFEADQLIEVNIDNGISRIVSDSVTGNGPDIFGPNGIALINGNATALVSNFIPDEMLSVDLGGGDRAIVSHANPSDDPPPISPNVGAGPTLFGPSGIGVINNSRVLVSNYAADEIIEVILQSGDRTILSADGTQGNGPPFSQPDGIAVGTSGLAYVTDALEGAVFSVDMTTGNGTRGDRVILSGGAVGSGPAFVRPVGIILDDANNRVIVTDYDANLLLSVGMNNGNRSILSDANSNVGSGPAFIFPAGIAFDEANNRAVVSGGNLIVVELGSGDRVIVGR